MSEQEPYDTIDLAGINHGINQGNLANVQANRLQYELDESEKTLAEAQLECEQTLSRLQHDLRQDIQEINNEGVPEWKENTNPKTRILTDEGVNKIMEIARRYINKETLLSNFDEKVIARRMLEFSLAFTGLIFMKYEIYFRRPTIEECYEILKERIDVKVEKKVMIARLNNLPYDVKAIEKKVLFELETVIDYEIEKIQDERKRANLREFEMLFVSLKALIESIHHRAWKGEERGSIRRRLNINEIIGTKNVPQMKRGLFGGWK